MNFQDTSTKIFLLAIVILSGLLITAAVVWGSRPATSPAVVDVKNIKTDTGPFIGNAQAPVTLIEFFDYQCPACKQFEFGALPQIIKDYVETGKVKIVFKDFAFLGADSTTAGEYSRAVWKLYPSAYFAWRTAMYTAQDDEGDKGFGDAASIDKLNATVPGIDATAVALDVKAHASEYLALINADKAEGMTIGVNSTPSIVVGTQLIAGSQPYATFKAALDVLVK